MPRWWIWITQFSCGLAFRMLGIISRLTFGLLFFKIEAKWAGRVHNLRGPIIVAPNHKTYVDFCFIIASLPLNSRLLPTYSIGADWLFKIPNCKGGFLMRWLIKSLGVDPAQKGAGLETSLGNLLTELKKDRVVSLHPEGGIKYRPGVFQVKRGAAYLAQKTGAPVLPIAIRGAEYFSLRSFFFGRRKVTVIFGEPLFVDPGKSLEETSEDIRKSITDLYTAVF